jgi:DNA primase
MTNEGFQTGQGHPACDYAFGRGFLPDTLAEWQFGYDERSKRLVFAVRDEQNRLVGFKGRALDGRHPKYLVIGDRPGKPAHYGYPCYQTGKLVFGLSHALKLADPYDEDRHRHLIVCEGELNAVALWQAGYPAVAISGSNFTEDQERLLIRHADSVTLFFDSDEAGDRAAWGYTDSKGQEHLGAAQKLRPFIGVRLVPPHEDDPASMSEQQIADLIDSSVGSITYAL